MNRESYRYLLEPRLAGVGPEADESNSCLVEKQFSARLVAGRAVDKCGQAIKSAWGMPWRQKAMKGVEGCEKPGVAVKRALIPGFPNRQVLNP